MGWKSCRTTRSGLFGQFRAGTCSCGTAPRWSHWIPAHPGNNPDCRSLWQRGLTMSPTHKPGRKCGPRVWAAPVLPVKWILLAACRIHRLSCLHLLRTGRSDIHKHPRLRLGYPQPKGADSNGDWRNPPVNFSSGGCGPWFDPTLLHC